MAEEQIIKNNKRKHSQHTDAQQKDTNSTEHFSELKTPANNIVSDADTSSLASLASIDQTIINLLYPQTSEFKNFLKNHEASETSQILPPLNKVLSSISQIKQSTYEKSLDDINKALQNMTSHDISLFDTRILNEVNHYLLEPESQTPCFKKRGVPQRRHTAQWKFFLNQKQQKKFPHNPTNTFELMCDF